MLRWKKNLFVLWGAGFVLMAAMSSIMPFLPLHIAQNFGIASESEVSMWSGLIFGVNFLSAFLISPFWGKLADRYGRKVMLLRSGFGMAIVTLLMGFATNVYQLLFLRLINGLVAGFIPASVALIATDVPKEKTGYALGILNSGTVAGTIIGPLFGGVAAEFVGYNQIFIYTGILVFIGALLVLFLVNEEFTPVPKEESTSFIKDFKEIIQIKPLLAIFSVAFLIQYAIMNINPVLSLYVQEIIPPLGKVSFFAGIIVALTGFSNMIFSPKLGKLGDKYGSEKVLFFSLLTASILFVPQAFSDSVWQLMIWRFFLGITLGGLLPSVNSLISIFAPEGKESLTYSFCSSATFLGNFLGPITGGVLAGLVGFSGLFLFTGGLLLISTYFVSKSINKRIESIKLLESQEKYVCYNIDKM